MSIRSFALNRFTPIISIALFGLHGTPVELSAVNSKLDALLLTQERAQKAVEKQLEQAKRYEEGQADLPKPCS